MLIVSLCCVFIFAEGRCPVLSRASKGLTLKRVLEICVAGDVPKDYVCAKVPRGIISSAIFVIDLEKVDHRDITVDDNGIYGKHSSPSERVKVKLGDDRKIEEVATLNRGKSGNEDIEEEGELFVVRRQYSWHKASDEFCRIVTKVEHDGSFLRYAIVQYKIGDNYHQLSLAPHGNDKKKDEEPHLRTKPSVIEKNKEQGKGRISKEDNSTTTRSSGRH